MTANLFVDTWGWITLSFTRETRHQEVSTFYRTFGGRLYTTDYILDETFTLSFSRYPRTAGSVMRLLLASIDASRINLEHITADRFAEAWRFRERYSDKPNISFTDLTSMVVMQERGISTILTEDAHFTHVGLGFQLVP